MIASRALQSVTFHHFSHQILLDLFPHHTFSLTRQNSEDRYCGSFIRLIIAIAISLLLGESLKVVVIEIGYKIKQKQQIKD